MVHDQYSVIVDDMLLPFPLERLIRRLFSCHLRARMAQMGVRTTMAAMRASQSSIAQASAYPRVRNAVAVADSQLRSD
jgi:hypothetical protein